jgi:PAS domain-containing protein
MFVKHKDAARMNGSRALSRLNKAYRLAEIAVIEPFEDIEDARALAQAIVDTVREPLLVLDGDLRVLAVSRSFSRIPRRQDDRVEGIVAGLRDGPHAATHRLGNPNIDSAGAEWSVDARVPRPPRDRLTAGKNSGL